MDPPTNTPSRQPLVDDHDVHPNQSDDHMLFQPYSSQCTVTHGRQHAAASLASGSAAPQLTQSLLPPVNIPIYLDSHGSETDFQIIKMRKVTPRSIAYIACQVRFALSSVTSWRSVDGDFDYIQFWRTIVDFFERPPGREARQRVERLMEWWTRKVFGRSQREALSATAKANMSVNALARQRAQRDDRMFDSS
ncbi:hypothetical protein EV424DRAFT_1373308 [Suillus variegatus]|nr:hypothetical protein EV424DRAFT_1373308 [Suillus variegatus]